MASLDQVMTVSEIKEKAKENVQKENQGGSLPSPSPLPVLTATVNKAVWLVSISTIADSLQSFTPSSKMNYPRL